MIDNRRAASRRDFLAGVGGAGAALAAGALPASALAPSAQPGAWDTSWVDRVRHATHRAVFDAPSGDGFWMLAARYLDGVEAAYGLRAPNVAAVLNVRTRAVVHALSDATWAKYPIGEDANVTDPATNATSRRNPNSAPTPGMIPAMADATFARLHARGAIVLVCDFALGHLANRLAAKVGAAPDAVHRDLRAGFLPGAIAVPSGIFGMAEAQNAGCGYVPA